MATLEYYIKLIFGGNADKKVNEVKKGVQDVIKAAETPAEMSVNLDASSAKKAVDDVTSKMDSIPDAEASINVDGSEAEQTAEGAGKAIEEVPDNKESSINVDVGAALENIAHLAMAYQGLMTLIDQVQNKAEKVANPAMDYEQANKNILALSGATEQEMEKLSDVSKSLGASTKFTATEVANLQVELVKLGFSTTEILNATDGIVKLSAAVNEDLQGSTAVAGATLRGFRLEASEMNRVSDVMALSFSKSALDLFKFKESMKTLAPIASAAGFSLEETTAMLGKLADAGLNGSIAGMGLKNIMMELQDESSGVSELMGENVKTFEQVVDKLQELKDSNFDLADATEYLDKRSAASFLTLVNASYSLNDLKTSLDDAGGAAERMAKTQMDTLQGKILEFQSAQEALNITLMDNFLPILKTITENTTKFIQFLAENNDVLIGLGVTVGVVTAKIIQLKWAVISANAAMLANPVAQVIIGLTALGIGITTVIHELLEYNEKTERMIENQGEFIEFIYETNKGIEDLVVNQEKLNELTREYAKYTDKISASSAREEMKEVSRLIDEILAKYNADRSTKVLTFLSQEDLDKLNEYYIKEELLKQKAKEEDIQAQKEFNELVKELDKTKTLSKLQLLENELEKAKKHYESLGELTKENSEEHIKAIKEVYEIEKAIQDEKDSQQKVKEAEEKRIKAERKAEEKQNQAEQLAAFEEFNDRKIASIEDMYERERVKINEFYTEKKDMLLAYGLSEKEIIKQQNKELAKIDKAKKIAEVKLAWNTLMEMGENMKQFGKEGFTFWKRSAEAQAIVDTYAAATAAYKAMAGIPVVGPGLGVAAAAAAIAAGLANVAQIEAQEFADGGLFRGVGGGRDDANVIKISNGEYIVNEEKTRTFQPLLDFINFAPLSKVREAFTGFDIRQAVSIPIPKLAYANGGVVNTGSNELAEIKQQLEVINMNLVSQQQPVIVVETSDPEVRIRKDRQVMNRMDRGGDQYD